ERDLLHHRRLEIGLATRHENHLVMVAGVAAQKGDAAVGCGVADDEAEDAGVEVLHLDQVVDVEPDMAQARRCFLRHNRALRDLAVLLSKVRVPAEQLSNALASAQSFRCLSKNATAS